MVEMLFALLASLVFALPAHQIIKALPGQNITLPCHAPTNTSVIAVKWTRADLGSDYVIFDKDGEPDYENQHPTFENRVNLKDRQNGDISLVLTNVSTNDSGTYKCQVFLNTANWKNISTIKLNVSLPAQRNESREDEEKKKKNDGSNELVVVAGIVGIVSVVVGGASVAIIKYKCLKRKTNHPLPTQAAEQRNLMPQTSEPQNGVSVKMTNLDIKQ